MTQRLADRKTPSANGENCITEEIYKQRPAAVRLAEERHKWEAKQTFIVTIGECRNKIYTWLKPGMIAPEGAVLHRGKI